jgi:hypothetical protein
MMSVATMLATLPRNLMLLTEARITYEIYPPPLSEVWVLFLLLHRLMIVGRLTSSGRQVIPPIPAPFLNLAPLTAQDYLWGIFVAGFANYYLVVLFFILGLFRLGSQPIILPLFGSKSCGAKCKL